MIHGLLKVRDTVDEAAFLFYLRERSRKVQLMADAAGHKKNLISNEEAAYNFDVASTPVSQPSSVSKSPD